VAHHTDDIVMFDVPMPLESSGVEEYRKTWELFFANNRGGPGSFEVTDLRIARERHRCVLPFAAEDLRLNRPPHDGPPEGERAMAGSARASLLSSNVTISSRYARPEAAHIRVQLGHVTSTAIGSA
jgi:ketosteroid isomerase-like protein